MPVEIEDLTFFSFFKDLSRPQLEEVAQLCKWRSFDSGQTLVEEKTPGIFAFLISEGKVEVSFVIGDNGMVRVDQIGADEFFGCPALVPPYKYNSTIRALSPVKILSIEATGLRKLTDRDCQLATHFYKHLLKILLDRIVRLWLIVGK